MFSARRRVAFMLWCVGQGCAEACIDRQQCTDLHQGYCRYRVIKNQNCWYPSKVEHLTIQREKEPVIVIERHNLDKSRPPIDDDPNVWPKPSELR